MKSKLNIISATIAVFTACMSISALATSDITIKYVGPVGSSLDCISTSVDLGTQCKDGKPGIPLDSQGTLQVDGRSQITFYAKANEAFNVVFTQFGGASTSVLTTSNTSGLSINAGNGYEKNIPNAIPVKNNTILITGN